MHSFRSRLPQEESDGTCRPLGRLPCYPATLLPCCPAAGLLDCWTAKLRGGGARAPLGWCAGSLHGRCRTGGWPRYGTVRSLPPRSCASRSIRRQNLAPSSEGLICLSPRLLHSPEPSPVGRCRTDLASGIDCPAPSQTLSHYRPGIGECMARDGRTSTDFAIASATARGADSVVWPLVQEDGIAYGPPRLLGISHGATGMSRTRFSALCAPEAGPGAATSIPMMGMAKGRSSTHCST